MRKRSEMRYRNLKQTLLGYTSKKLTSQANTLKTRWRIFDFASTIASTLALFLAIVDYEKRYDNDRTHSTCSMHDISDGYRYVILLLSVVAIVLATIRHVIRVQWVNTVSIAREVYLTRRASLLNYKFLLEVIVLAIFPYPAFDSELHISQAVDASFSLVNLCYYWSEMLFIGMFVRVFFFFRAIVNYSKYLNDTSYAFCKDLDIKPNVRYAYRNLIRERPVIMLLVFLVLANLILAEIMRVFERPMDDFSNFNNKYFLSSLWLVAQTIFSCAYGDIYPWTTGGRGVAIFSSVIGVCVFSYLVFLIERAISLTTKERKVFVKINLVPTAARIVHLSFRYFNAKRQLGVNSPRAQEYFARLMDALDNHRSMTEFLNGKASIADEIVVELQSKELFNMMRRIERKVNRLTLESSLAQ
eukprot:CAMPEP_0204915246 /NCGR_PEP_ID=MMETSP1397-20131031/13281_1 /ASSEMBLY_ACC=CAM_ASM_000891 /TAXON_ID=49980 /ORGANISM="Climacostomum Climacostomum virens, Strain Stock W-24" /LENGTH=414 /DNA_ID=CAMNT_0052087197 /DNA_START=61 /DNA_END=1302 /DNA_ORIENTATION=-